MRVSLHKITESVIPVILLLGAIFVLLFFVQYRASLDADKAKYIHITSTTAMPSLLDDEMDSHAETDFSDDPRVIKAQALITQKMYKDAENIYFSVLAKKPSTQVHNWLGVLYLKQKQYHKAVVSFSHALKLSPRNYRARYNRALAYSSIKEEIKAIKDYKKVIKSFDAHTKSHFNLGLLYYKQKLYDYAILEFEKTASLSSGDKKAKALYLLGKSYMKLTPASIEKAEETFTAVIRLKPDHISSRLALIKIEYPKKTQDYEEHIQALQALAELNPENLTVYRIIADIHHANNNMSQKLVVLEEALRHAPNNIELQIETALLLMQENKTQEAIFRLENVITLDPSNTKVYFLLGRLYYLQENYEAALSSYAKIHELKPKGSAELWNNLGLLYTKMKQYEKAQEMYKKALGLRKTYPEAYYNLGLLFVKMKELKKAQDSFEKAIELRPKYAQAFYSLGSVFAQLKEHEKSAMAYEKSLLIFPNRIRAKFNLALQYSKLNSLDKAQNIYKDILEKDESYFIAWLNLGRINYQLKAYKDSIQALNKAISLEPEHKRAHRALAKSYRALKMFDEALLILEKLLEKDPSSIKTRLIYARSYYRYKKYKLALAEYEKILKLEPKNKVAKKMTKRIKRKLRSKK